MEDVYDTLNEVSKDLNDISKNKDMSTKGNYEKKSNQTKPIDLEEILSKQDLIRLERAARAVQVMNRQVKFLNASGIHFTEPLQKSFAEIELEAKKRHNDECSHEYAAFIQGALFVTSNE